MNDFRLRKCAGGRGRALRQGLCVVQRAVSDHHAILRHAYHGARVTADRANREIIRDRTDRDPGAPVSQSLAHSGNILRVMLSEYSKNCAHLVSDPSEFTRKLHLILFAGAPARHFLLLPAPQGTKYQPDLVAMDKANQVKSGKECGDSNRSLKPGIDISKRHGN